MMVFSLNDKKYTVWLHLVGAWLCGVMLILYIRRRNICDKEKPLWEKHTGIVEMVHINGNDSDITMAVRVDEKGIVKVVTVQWPDGDHRVRVGESVEIHHNLATGQWGTIVHDTTDTGICAPVYMSYILFGWFSTLLMLDAFFVLRGIKAK